MAVPLSASPTSPPRAWGGGTCLLRATMHGTPLYKTNCEHAIAEHLIVNNIMDGLELPDGI